MNKYIVIILMLTIAQVSVAQKIDFFGIAEYDMYVAKSSPIPKKAVLYYERSKSIFIYDQIKDNKEEPSEQQESDGSTNITIVHGDSIGDFQYKDIGGNTLKSRSFIKDDPYVISESLDIIDWNILEDTKIIGQFNCQKAKAKFKGRNYTVWFTTQIPISTGPWKFWGLPGLIIDASSEDKEVYFRLTKIIETKQPKTKNIFFVGKGVTPEQYKKLEAKYWDNFRVLMESLAEKGVQVEYTIDTNTIEKEN